MPWIRRQRGHVACISESCTNTKQLSAFRRCIAFRLGNVQIVQKKIMLQQPPNVASGRSLTRSNAGKVDNISKTGSSGQV